MLSGLIASPVTFPLGYVADPAGTVKGLLGSAAKTFMPGSTPAEKFMGAMTILAPAYGAYVHFGPEVLSDAAGRIRSGDFSGAYSVMRAHGAPPDMAQRAVQAAEAGSGSPAGAGSHPGEGSPLQADALGHAGAPAEAGVPSTTLRTGNPSSEQGAVEEAVALTEFVTRSNWMPPGLSAT